MKIGAGKEERQQGLGDRSASRTPRQADGDCSAVAGSTMHHHSNKICSLCSFLNAMLQLQTSISSEKSGLELGLFGFVFVYFFFNMQLVSSLTWTRLSERLDKALKLSIGKKTHNCLLC